MYIIQSLNFLALIRFCNKRSIGCLLLYCVITMQVKVGLGKFTSASTWTLVKSMLSNRLAEIEWIILLIAPPFISLSLPPPLSLDPHPGERLWCPSDDSRGDSALPESPTREHRQVLWRWSSSRKLLLFSACMCGIRSGNKTTIIIWYLD